MRPFQAGLRDEEGERGTLLRAGGRLAMSNERCRAGTSGLVARPGTDATLATRSDLGAFERAAISLQTAPKSFLKSSTRPF